MITHKGVKKLEVIKTPTAPTNPFMVPAQDLKGHSVAVSLRIMPSIVREIEILMTSHRDDFGWKTNSDFHRWAVFNALETANTLLKEKGPSKLNNHHKHTRAMLVIIQQNQNAMEFNDMFGQAERMVDDLHRMGRKDLVKNTLRHLYNEITTMDPGDWRNHYRSEFKKRFKRMMGWVSLSPKDFERD